MGRGRYWLWLGARLAVAIAVIAYALSFLGTGGGEKEFQKTLEAMKQVRSFRMATSATPYTQRNDALWEVDCNHNLVHHMEHYVNTCTNPPDCSQQSDFRQEELDFAVWRYLRKADGTWATGGQLASRQTQYACGHLAEGTDSGLLPPIATMVRRGVMQKGDKKTVNGVRCREWLVTLKGGMNGLEHDTLCLGIEDHLPYEMTVDWAHARTLFSDYNVPMHFDLPEEVLKATSVNGSN